MKKKLNGKLNEKATRVLVKDLNEKELETVTGGVCKTCGLLVTPEI
jgi:bacteriocin-like protein